MTNQQIKNLAKAAVIRNLPLVSIVLIGQLLVLVAVNYLTYDLEFIVAYPVSLIVNAVSGYWVYLYLVKSFDRAYPVKQWLSELNWRDGLMFSLKTMAVSLMTLLWMVLLIIPGLIKAFAYALVPFIAIEQPELSIRDTLKRSEQLMQGRKLDLLGLSLSFIGWIVVTVLTFGLAALYVLPYINYATLIFYQQCLPHDIDQLVIDSLSDPDSPAL